jgi:hypothetical protein
VPKRFLLSRRIQYSEQDLADSSVELAIGAGYVDQREKCSLGWALRAVRKNLEKDAHEPSFPQIDQGRRDWSRVETEPFCSEPRALVRLSILISSDQFADFSDDLEIRSLVF